MTEDERVSIMAVAYALEAVRGMRGFSADYFAISDLETRMLAGNAELAEASREAHSRYVHSPYGGMS